MKNSNLHAARSAKQDEFYTRIEDIERELRRYADQFEGKTVFLNCDDPTWSNFWRYFDLNFDALGLKRLIATHYHPTEPTYKIERTAEGTVQTPLLGNGDFRSPEALALLAESDIVVTNPPFSLFREYVSVLVESGKSWLVIGNMNAITYKEVWSLIQDGKVWLGTGSNPKAFRVPESAPQMASQFVGEDGERYQTFGNIVWFTNMDHPRRHEEVPLFRRYADDPAAYPTYANYDAIEVSKVADIPVDYEGEMGVPITFLGKHNPEQFEIVGQSRMIARDHPIEVNGKLAKDFVYRDGDNVVYPYMRIVVRRVRKA